MTQQHINRPSHGSDDDRRWFEQRPHRCYRLRRALSEDAPDDSSGAWVIVRQIAPGVRMRAVVGLNTDWPADDEANARRLFESATGFGKAQEIVRSVERLAR